MWCSSLVWRPVHDSSYTVSAKTSVPRIMCSTGCIKVVMQNQRSSLTSCAMAQMGVLAVLFLIKHHLHACRYKLRRQVELVDVSQQYAVWVMYGDSTQGKGEALGEACRGLSWGLKSPTYHLVLALSHHQMQELKRPASWPWGGGILALGGQDFRVKSWQRGVLC